MKTSVSWDRAELVIDAKITTITKRNFFMAAFIANVRGAHNKSRNCSKISDDASWRF
jgi:hypothetical protein